MLTPFRFRIESDSWNLKLSESVTNDLSTFTPKFEDTKIENGDSNIFWRIINIDMIVLINVLTIQFCC